MNKKSVFMHGALGTIMAIKKGWNRVPIGNRIEWFLCEKPWTKLVDAIVSHIGLFSRKRMFVLRIFNNPVTGKPWKSMREAKQWYNGASQFTNYHKAQK